jgi:sialate O-acetylesterase
MNTQITYISMLTALLLVSINTSFAFVKLASPFSNHMVLQQNTQVPVWGMADPGEKVTVKFGGQTKSVKAAADGTWMLKLEKLKAGGPFVMDITGKNQLSIKDVYVGEVWLCSGQSNMDMTVAREDRYWCGVINEQQEVAAANFPLIRVFDTDYAPSNIPQKEVKGKWEVISPTTVGHLSAVAYFFARDIQKKIKVPIGLITTAFGASTAEAWIRKEALAAKPELQQLLDGYNAKLEKYRADTAGQRQYRIAFENWKVNAEKAKMAGKDAPKGPKNPDPERDQHNPYVLWNGMVKPLLPYAIKGVLWYQGESNSPTANIYRNIMETLISDWRSQWGQGDFPFLYVQLANIGKTVEEVPAKGGSEALKREAQLQNLSLNNTAMVVAMDNADPDNQGNVHPKNKQEIGRRLSLAALAKVYGEKISYSGPVYNKMEVKGNEVRLYFKNIDGGLTAKDNQLLGFAIAGDDKKFVWATARIENDVVVVSAPQITKPVAVRYGWGSNPPISLYSKENFLPASPFRTDSK